MLYSVFQGYVEATEPIHFYRVYCQLDGVYVYTINTVNAVNNEVAVKDVAPPDYESVVTADLEDLPNYDQVVQLQSDDL